LNPAGFVQGGLLSAMLDDTMGPAVLIMTEGRSYTTTVSLTVTPVNDVPVGQDQSVTTEAVMAYCKGQLAGYKTPRVIHLRSELPKTNVGKILRRELRESAAAKPA